MRGAALRAALLVPHRRWKLGASKGMKGGGSGRVRELGAPRVLCSGMLVLPCGPWSPLCHLSITQGEAAGFPQPSPGAAAVPGVVLAEPSVAQPCWHPSRQESRSQRRSLRLLALAGPQCLPVQGVAPGNSQGVLCQCVALPWHHLCVPCGKYGLKALPVVLGVLVAVLEGSTCHPAAAPSSRQRAGIGMARAAGEVPGAFSRGREPLVDALAGTSRGLWGPLPVPGHRGSPRPPPAPPSPGGERAAAGYSSSRAAHGLSQRLCVGSSDE